MFKVNFYEGTNCLFYGTTRFLPRQGEKINLNDKLYQVVDVVYMIKQGISATTEVLIRLKKF